MAKNTVDLLNSLGLTEYEAKTIATLFELKEDYAPQISRQAQVPKTRVYDVLDRLVKKNLVIEIQGRPKKYMANAPEKVFNILLTERKTELNSLEERTKTAVETLKDITREDLEKEKVLKVKEYNDFLKILAQEIEKAESSIVGFARLSSSHNSLKDALKKAKRKNVNVKIIKSNDLSNDLFESIEKNSLKEKAHSLNAYVIDGKKVILGLNDFERQGSDFYFSIWNENEHLAEMISHFFQKNWKE